MLKALMAAVLIGSAATAVVAGPTYSYSTTNPTQNSAGGTISSINTTFDAGSKMFTWDVSFSDGVAKNTQGFWLVVSSGPNPKGIQKQLAIMYFDATSMANPAVSIYRYNGANSNSSFSDPADLLASSKQAGQTTIQASASDAGGKRSFSLKVNAATIDSMYNAGNGYPDWEGIQFGDHIGVWFHTASGLSTAYNGLKLTKFSPNCEGWYDDANQCTRVPAPGSAALMAAGGLLAFRRRRA